MSSSASIVSELKPAMDGLLCKLVEVDRRVGSSPMDCIRFVFTISSCNYIIMVADASQTVKRTRNLQSLV